MCVVQVRDGIHLLCMRREKAVERLWVCEEGYGDGVCVKRVG